MMGLEPTTFCMANARDVRTRSHPFAQTVCFPASSSARPNATEPERTANLAILAMLRAVAERHDGRSPSPFRSKNRTWKAAAKLSEDVPRNAHESKSAPILHRLLVAPATQGESSRSNRPA
jgi:hypothetical protein